MSALVMAAIALSACGAADGHGGDGGDSGAGTLAQSGAGGDGAVAIAGSAGSGGAPAPSPSKACGVEGSRCSTSSPACDYCNADGTRLHCECGTSQEVTCTPTSGGCGVACGDRRCLDGEICVTSGRYSGAGGGGPAPLQTTSSCELVPEACGAQVVSCETCIAHAFQCEPAGSGSLESGTCTDQAAGSFLCIQTGY